MSNIYKNYDIRMFQLGLMASRAAAVPSATANLFTISGGDILLTSLTGEITTVFDAGATTLKLRFAPTEATATALDLSAATAAQGAAAVGRHYHLPTLVGSALATDDATLSGFAEQITPYLLPPGVISLVVATGQTTGKLKWDLTYIPLDDSSNVQVN
jgi:hypothetical protein